MGQKISPTSLRLNITENWRSRWFNRGKKLAETLQQDHEIRTFIQEKFKKAGILKIEIERFADQVHLIIHTSRPGMLIGRGGSSIEDLRKSVQKMAKLSSPPRITIPTEDAKTIASSARAVAQNIAEALEKRVPYRKVCKRSLEQLMQANIKGAKITVGGRLNGAEIARSESFQKGKLPLHTLRADIDFAKETAFTTFGTIGVKVWVYKDDVLDSGNQQEEPQADKEDSSGTNRSNRGHRPAKK